MKVNKKYKNILVTGGAGFIGSHLVEKLVEEEKEVTVVDNFSNSTMENLKKVRNKIELIRADIRDKDVGKYFCGIEAIYHLAALVSVEESFKNPGKTIDINVNGTVNILNNAVKYKINKLVFASSAAVYGAINKENIRETDPIYPLSSYGYSKFIDEEIIKDYSKKLGINTISLRFFNVYGPRQKTGSPYSGVISNFIDKINHNKDVTIFGDGNQTRDFIYIEDVVEALYLSLNINNGDNYIFNVGTGEITSINNLYKMIMHVSLLINNRKSKSKVIYKPARLGDIISSGANIANSQKKLKFQATHTLSKGLEEIIKLVSK